jgi:histidinol-phosphate phosphatase family protein
MANVDLGRFWRAHKQTNAVATLFVHPNDHPHDSDLVELDETSRVTAFHPYPHPPGWFYRNLVNAALYVIDRTAFAPWQSRPDLADFGRHLFPAMVESGVHLQGYVSPEYIKDAGTPERLDRVTADYESGRVDRGSFETPAPAIFLDRDGTLNREVNRVKSVEELEILDGVPEAIALLNRAGYRAVVISNQPVVARGDCDEKRLREINNKLETLLGWQHAYLDAIYCCPHHPDKGFPGERPELKIDCSCRKPRAGLIEQATRDLNLDLSRSWMIGDTWVDVRTARTAGIRSILVRTGHGGSDSRQIDRADHEFDTLLDAVRFVLNFEGLRPQ